MHEDTKRKRSVRVARHNRGILVYNICHINISNSVSGGATNVSPLNIKRSQYN